MPAAHLFLAYFRPYLYLPGIGQPEPSLERFSLFSRQPLLQLFKTPVASSLTVMSSFP